MLAKARRGVKIGGSFLLAAALLTSAPGSSPANAAEPLWRVRAPGAWLGCSADHKTLLVAGGTTEVVCVDADGGVRWRFGDGSGRRLLTGANCLSADGAFAVVGGVSEDPTSGEFVPTQYVLDAKGKPVAQIRVPGSRPWPSISNDGRLILSVDLPPDRRYEPTADEAVGDQEISLYRRDGTRLWSWQEVEPAPGEHGRWNAAIAGWGDGVIAWAEDGTITFIDSGGKRWWQIAAGGQADPEIGNQLRLSSDGDAFVFCRNGSLNIPKVEVLDWYLSVYGRRDRTMDATECLLSSLLAYQLTPAERGDAGKADVSELFQEYLAVNSDQALIHDAGIEAAGRMHVIYVARKEGVELIRIVPDRAPQRTLLTNSVWGYGDPLIALSGDGRYLAVGVQAESATAEIRDGKILVLDNAGRAIRAIPLPEDEMPIGRVVVSGALRRLFFLERSMKASGLVCYAFPQ